MPSHSNVWMPAFWAPRSIVRTTTPAASLIVTVTASASFATAMPYGALPSASVILSPATTTSRPTRLIACRYWPAAIDAESEATVSLSLLMPETVLICASCVVTCALSSGFSGSRLRNCVTSSVRKRSEASCAAAAALSFAAAASEVPADDPVLFALSSAFPAFAVNGDLTPSGAAPFSIDNAFTRLVMEFLLFLLAERQRLQEQRLRGTHHLDARLVAARRREHVHHLVDDAHVGERHVALAIGGRVLRVVDAARGRGVLDDAGDLHAREPVGRRLRLEDDLLGL